ncbi:MAG: hypothetical protein IPF92_06715 [Myxococcales bacterium]|nr:hypothetical protein [Myxococcales bacterium]HQY60076.1 hypothetical protein [Polyangiaceae bacterium]
MSVRVDARRGAGAAGAALALSMALAACGGEPPAKEPEGARMPTPNRAAPPLPQVSQELGQIDPALTDRAFERVKPKLLACQTQGQKRLDYLAGDAKFFARIDATGKVRWIYLEESTLGDRDTERCVLDVLTGAPWPAPVGGEAEVQKGFGFDLHDAREPSAWGPEKAAVGAKALADAVKQCRDGKSGPPFQVTVYVEPDGSHGKVASVGVAGPTKEAAAQIDCVAAAARAMRFPSPGSYAAKVTFSL